MVVRESVGGLFIFLIIEHMELRISTMKHWICLLEGMQFQKKWKKLLINRHMPLMKT